MENNNRQSINNYVYNRRRNREPEPVQNENDFDFTNRNNDSSQNTSSSMYNSYVSESDYNSYTSGYQQNNSYSGYHQPNQFNNNYSQPNQFNNNYNQPQQNVVPTYNDYNAPMPQGYFGRHDAIEIPLKYKMKLSTIIILVSFAVVFIFMIGMALLNSVFNINADVMMIIVTVVFFMGFIGMAVGMVAGSAIDRKQFQKVCTVSVQGSLVGYEKRRRSHKGHHYSVYAPKYEIFINNRYEVRTVDDFRRGKDWGNRINLLANPDGYEIIPATRADFPRNQISIAEIIALIIIILIITINNLTIKD